MTSVTDVLDNFILCSLFFTCCCFLCHFLHLRPFCMLLLNVSPPYLLLNTSLGTFLESARHAFYPRLSISVSACFQVLAMCQMTSTVFAFAACSLSMICCFHCKHATVFFHILPKATLLLASFSSRFRRAHICNAPPG